MRKTQALSGFERIHALILAGGSGTRLWPLSREEMPKQFLSLCGQTQTLLQSSVNRLCPLVSKDDFWVVASDCWRSLVIQQLTSFGFDADHFIDEPEGRNTAPAIAFAIASMILRGVSVDDFLLVCPSDHIIADIEAFQRAVSDAVESASAGNLVVFGVKPTAPETGFGYVKVKKELPIGGVGCAVDSFVEKPTADVAEQYLASGNYYWNGGLFCFRIKDMMQAMTMHYPESKALFDASMDTVRDLFLMLPKLSIDYAVMEKATNIVCVPLDAGWSDVGSWSAVYENSVSDDAGNVLAGDVILQGSKGNMVIAPDRLVCGVDIEDMVVVDTPDALFISPRSSSQKLRSIVDVLKECDRKELRESVSSARPWGRYTILADGDRHKIKRIVVEPGKRLSLQYHVHRSEHWIVVQGTARVMILYPGETPSDAARFLHEGESVFVPKGRLHRLENPGKIPLEIIEVQIGEYVGEDDIVRVDDDFNRAGNV